MMLLLCCLWLAQDTELVRQQHEQTLRYWQEGLARHRPNDRTLAARTGFDPRLAKGPLQRRLITREPNGVRIEEWSVAFARAIVRIPPRSKRAIITRRPITDDTAIVCRPLLTDRSTDHELSQRFRGKDRRHILHRLAFPVGRTVTAIDAEQILALAMHLRKLTKNVEAVGLGVSGYVASRFDPRLRAEAPAVDPLRGPVDEMILGGIEARGAAVFEFGDPEPLAERDAHFEALLNDLRSRIQNAVPQGGKLAAFLGVREEKRLPLQPRITERAGAPAYRLFDVWLPVLNGVDAYGLLLLPRQEGRRPAVIAQHGLGGQPLDLIDQNNKTYHAFAARLAERGFAVLVPYVTHPLPPAERINPLARLAAAQGRTRISLEVTKLRQLVDFLERHPSIDGQRIAYYGLSYGGYSALWMTPLEPRIRAVVVSGHFNDWRRKITDERLNTSYLFHPDEDFYHFDVLHRFTHVELVEALAPRPVLIEYGTRDPVTPREWHEAAWARIKRPAVERDLFDGVHEIHGEPAFAFLEEILVRQARDSGSPARSAR